MPRLLKKNQHARFLEALSEGATIKSAAQAGGFSRPTAYRWRGEDEQFAKAWDSSIEDGSDVLEQEAVRRATGWEEVIVDKDGNEHTVLRYSDTLLIFLLKGRRPTKFRDRQTVEMTGPGGGPIETKTEVNVEHDADRAGKILEVLERSGLVPPGAPGANGSAGNGVHPAHAD